jgi:hypothetical protein
VRSSVVVPRKLSNSPNEQTLLCESHRSHVLFAPPYARARYLIGAGRVLGGHLVSNTDRVEQTLLCESHRSHVLFAPCVCARYLIGAGRVLGEHLVSNPDRVECHPIRRPLRQFACDVRVPMCTEDWFCLARLSDAARLF